MNGDFLLEKSILFKNELDKKKKEIDNKFPWYPYNTLNNFIHLREIFDRNNLNSLANNNKKILDIGAADGDLSFFLESLGYKVDILDNGPTNYNNLKGAKNLKEKLNSTVGIYEVNLDSQFVLPHEQYDLVFFLGILYHLKNPFYILEALSCVTNHLILSTRVAQFTPDGTSISKNPMAYLLDPDESNNDATNFWVFSDSGLKRILDRTGWHILDIINLGDTKASNPRDNSHDERSFALLRSNNI